jgi:hypothetical protein
MTPQIKNTNAMGKKAHGIFCFNHGDKQALETFRELAAGYYPLRFAGLFTAAVLDNSPSKFQFAKLLKFEAH